MCALFSHLFSGPLQRAQHQSTKYRNVLTVARFTGRLIDSQVERNRASYLSRKVQDASPQPRTQTSRMQKRLLPAFAMLTIEKYGVEPHAKPKDPFEGCSAVFYAHHTVSQRVTDYERVLGELKREPWWNGQLVLFGGSEGGGTVFILAAKVNPTAVVIFSAALGHSFGDIFKLSVPPAVAHHADDEFKKIEAEPLSAKVWGGNSYRWWADILRQDVAADLLETESPILLV